MGQKIKSKFMFPMPGRRVKDASPTTVSAPLSKAQRLLGTGEINVDYKGPPKDHEAWEAWEAHSTSGMSIAVSETTLGGRTDTTYRTERYDRVPRLTIDDGGWDEESDIVPRHMHSLGGRGLRQQRSAATIGADYYGDTATDISSLRRRLSNSTIGTHYDKTHVPLSVSQQTSNSAIAQGPNLGQFSPAATANDRKKRPSKLDLLRGKLRNDSAAGTQNASSHLGSGHTLVRSPSMMSFKTSWGGPTPSLAPEQRTPNKLFRRSQQPPLKIPSPRTNHRPLRDTSGLHQLYDHYEEMSFRNAPSPTDEDTPDFLNEDPFETSQRPHTAQTSASLPTSKPLIREPCSPSDQSSTRTRNLTSGSGTTDTMDSTLSSVTDYAASVSSRHTRTSKASRTDRSIQSLDRQQTSILSLSDSDSDEDIERSPPRSAASPHLMPRNAENNLSYLTSMDHAGHSPTQDRAGVPSTAQIKPIKNYLDIPRASSRTTASRPRSNSTLRSHQSATSTASPYSGASSSSSHAAPRSNHSFASEDEEFLAHVHEAQSVTFHPVSSTAEAAANDLDAEAPISDFQQMLSRPASHGRTRDSRSSEQPTPPLSPNSVEFYFRSPESIRRDSTASNSSEKNNPRLMAVTRQEEMLLAAVRAKRAKMRQSSLSSGSATEKGSRTSETSAKSPPGQKVIIPRRRSSIVAAEAVEPNPADLGRKTLGTLQEEGPRSEATESVESSPESYRPIRALDRKEGKARQERVLLYLDRPINRVRAIDAAEPSPDLTDFMGSIDERNDVEWAEDNGRTRIKSTRWTTFTKHGFVSGDEPGRPRADSAAVNPRTVIQAPLPLAELSGTDSEYDEDDLHMDDFDFDDFPEVPVVSQPVAITAPLAPLPLPPKKAPATTEGHRSRKSLARLSAVGGPAAASATSTTSPVPWWGDDD
ncbi:hypothetical protein MN608_07512 [Microdochium nivale]|nr:hypothetical protein MN608_07512 [Microdochium nivale]